MSTAQSVAQAIADLKAALETPDMRGTFGRAYTDMGGNVEPPAVVIGPPTLRWEGTALAPTSARIGVYVVVDSDELHQESLMDLVPQVAAAIDNLTAAVVIEANPGTWKAGTTDLPSYEITTEVSL